MITNVQLATKKINKIKWPTTINVPSLGYGNIGDKQRKQARLQAKAIAMKLCKTGTRASAITGNEASVKMVRIIKKVIFLAKGR